MFSPGWGSPAVSLTSCSNATKRPSGDIEASRAPPRIAPLTILVVPAWRSRTKMLGLPSTSAGSSFAASEPKATRRPSAEIEAAYEFASPPRLTYVGRALLQVAHEDVDGRRRRRRR